jgi:hypothetical protein
MSHRPMTLVITNSIDHVVDLLVTKLGSDNVFRYNTDLWKDYKLLISEKTVEIEDPTGRRVTEDNIVKVYRRSSMRASTIFPTIKLTDAERYDEEEVWMAWSDLINIFWDQGKVVLTQPFSTTRSGKMQQMRIATKYFNITPFRFVVGGDWLRPGTQSVVKSFNFKFSDGIGFYARKVDEGDLDTFHPWFLTDFVGADEDVTVALVRDELFAFSLNRDLFIDETIDWRKAPTEYAHRGWKPVSLPAAIDQAIFSFASEMGIHYARLDFLKQGPHYVFLEANFSGEWGWLDPDGKHGLMAKILHEIDPRTPCISCPRPTWR